MKLSKKTLDHIASLSKLSLTKEEEESIAIYLGKKMKQGEVMHELNTDKVKPTINVLPLYNIVRDDLVDDYNKPEELLENAPEKKEGYFIVPKAVEEGV